MREVKSPPPNPGLILAVDPGAKPGFCYFERIPILVTTRIEMCTIVPNTIIVERPEIRRGPKGKINPASIVTLGITAGFIAGDLFRRFGVTPIWVRPATWKGCVDGDVMINRIRGAFPGYLPASATGDEVDAVGIAAWCGGRNWVRVFA